MVKITRTPVKTTGKHCQISPNQNSGCFNLKFLKSRRHGFVILIKQEKIKLILNESKKMNVFQ